MSKTKVCSKCEKRKPLSAFYPSPTYKYGVLKICKVCKGKIKSAWYAIPENAAAYKADSRRYKETVPGRARTLLGAAKKRARMFGVKFDLTREWLLKKLEPLKCEVTGLDLRLKIRDDMRIDPRGPSLDRKNKKGGYTKRNTRVVCSWFNLARNEFDDADVMLCANALVKSQYNVR